MPSPSVVAGVAGGQFFLAAQVAPGGAARRFAHDRTGRRALRHGLVRQGVERGACEAPGRYHRRLPQCLHAAGLETVVAHPQHARRFAAALGQLAQTARVEAAMLARRARLEAFEAAPPAPQKILELPDLEAARRLLAQPREALGKHLQEASRETCRRALRAVLRVLARRLQRLRARLAATLAADAARARRAALRASLPGLGPVSVAALLAGMPELGALGRRAAAGLLGGAPCARASGLRSGERRIPGGRPHPRRVLSRAALSASRCNPPLRAFSQRLRARGQGAQAALVAVLRKLIVLADVLLRQDRLGSAQAPLPECARGRGQRPGRALLAEQRLGAPGTDAKARFRA